MRNPSRTNAEFEPSHSTQRIQIQGNGSTFGQNDTLRKTGMFWQGKIPPPYVRTESNFQGFAPKTGKEEDEDEEQNQEEEKPKPKFTKKLVPISLLSRSLEYRQFVEKLQSCKLLKSLLLIRQPMALTRILAQTNISSTECIEFDPFYYPHFKQINENSILWFRGKKIREVSFAVSFYSTRALFFIRIKLHILISRNTKSRRRKYQPMLARIEHRNVWFCL